MLSRSKPGGILVNTIPQLAHFRMSKPFFLNNELNVRALQIWQVSDDSLGLGSELPGIRRPPWVCGRAQPRADHLSGAPLVRQRAREPARSPRSRRVCIAGNAGNAPTRK